MIKIFDKSRPLLFSPSRIRELYRVRTATTPTEGNRTGLNTAICVTLLILMAIATFESEYSNIISHNFVTIPAPYVTRHTIAFFMLLMFLLVDGSPETMALGMALGCEAVGRSIDYKWITPPTPDFWQHYFFQMGDILRIFFATQLARVSSKYSLRWILFGSLLSVPYGLAMQISPWFAAEIAPHLRSMRDILIGFIGFWICVNVAIVIARDNIPWRFFALVVGAVSFLVDPLEFLLSIFCSSEIMVNLSPGLTFYRNISYLLYALSAFINISTIERRIQALSHAQAEDRVKIIRQERKIFEAIAKTTQMLAHDVRKPFSLIGAYMGIIANAKDSEETARIITKMVPDVRQSLKLIDQLIADIIDVGRDVKPATIPCPVVDSIFDALSQTFRSSANPNITFEFKWEHRSAILADRRHLQRIFTNIFDNAEQALQGKSETIFIHTWDHASSGGDRVYVSIRNTGSYISDEDRLSIFEAFFTKNKVGGTGLGLAIVKKFTDLNNGSVEVTSDIEKGTEFKFSFPAKITTSPEIRNLPHSSKDLQIASLEREKPLKYVSTDNSTITPENRPKGIYYALVVDDDPVYADLVHSNLMKAYNGHLEVKVAYDYLQATHLIENIPFDIIISDYFLDSRTHDGLDLLDYAKKLHPSCFSALHTNHVQTPELAARIQSQKSVMLKKPLTVETITQLLRKSAFPPPSISAKNLAIIEDDLVFADFLSARLNSAKIHVYDSPDEFMRLIDNDQSLLKSFDLIVTDLRFDGSALTGVDIAKAIRKLGFPPIVLYSNIGKHESGIDPAVFDLIIDKTEDGIEKLKSFLA